MSDTHHGRWGILSLCLAATAPALLGAPGGMLAQDSSGLTAPEATAEATFTQVTSVRELPDGRLLVADRLEDRLVVIDWEGPAAQIGRLGDGPHEFRDVGFLYAIDDSTTLFTDTYSNRWILLHYSQIVDSFTGNRPLNRELTARLYGGSEGGFVLGAIGYAHRSSRARRNLLADSLLLVLADLDEGVIDTVARVQGMGSEGFTLLPPSGGSPGSMVEFNPLATHDQPWLFPDGWIAVAKVRPYRVDWRLPSGAWRRGGPLPFRPGPLSDGDKCGAIRWRRFPGGETCDPDIYPGWPQTMPPFVFDRTTPVLLATPEGNVAILRTPSASQGVRRYDVVDRNGRLVKTVTMGENQFIAGFGSASVYVVETDAYDLQTLSRHRWP